MPEFLHLLRLFVRCKGVCFFPGMTVRTAVLETCVAHRSCLQFDVHPEDLVETVCLTWHEISCWLAWCEYDVFLVTAVS